MRIALLTPFHQRELNRADDYFLLRGWEQALVGHDTFRLSRFDEPSLEIKRTLASFDLALVMPSHSRRELTAHGEHAIAAAGVAIVNPAQHEALATFKPEWFVQSEPLAESIPKPVFCPSADHLKLSREIYATLNSWQPTLFMANEAEELRTGIAPGMGTLFAPFFPEAHVKAVATASFVVTLNKTVALTAAALRVPVLFVTSSEDESEELVRLGMETIVFGTEEPLSSIARRVKLKAANGLPLVTETTCQSQLAREANKIALVVAPEPTPFAEEAAALNVGCIADWRYVPFLLGLAANLRAVHTGPVRLFVLAMDDKTEHFLADSKILGDGAVYRLTELWEKHSLKLLQYRSMAYQAYTCKPKILQKILDVTGGPALYCDLDIFYYESPLSWVQGLGEKGVRVCPQRNDFVEYDRFYGFFQAGLIAVNDRAPTFLAWWSRLSFYKCLNTRRTHDFFMEDQGYLDLAPVLFAEFGIDWSGEQNVAPWNLGSLSAYPDTEYPWRPVLGDGTKGKSLHAAHTDKFAFAHAKYVWDQIALFFSAYPENEADELLPQVITAQAAYLGPLCYAFEFETAARLVLRTPEWFANRPKRFLELWHSPLRGLAAMVAKFLLARRTASRAHRQKFWVHKPARMRRQQQRRTPPPLNWAEMVTTLIRRREKIERLIHLEPPVFEKRSPQKGEDPFLDLPPQPVSDRPLNENA